MTSLPKSALALGALMGFLLALLAFGAWLYFLPSGAVVSGPGPTKPSKTKVDPAVSAYCSHALAFVDEAKSVMRHAAELGPTMKEFQPRRQSLDQLFSRIPEPPAGLEGPHKELKKVIGTAFVIEQHLRLAESFVGLNEAKQAKHNWDLCKKYARDQLAALDEIASKLKTASH